MTSRETAAAYVPIGAAKIRMSAARTLVLAIFAGAFIALAGLGSAAVSATVADPSLARLLSAAVFPAGLVMVVLTGAELFTGNSLLLIPLLCRKIRLGGMLRNWLLVYLGNFIGAAAVAAAVVCGHTLNAYDGALLQSVCATAAAKSALSFGDAFLRGIFCNFLVCLAVFMALSATHTAGKIAALYFPIFLFVACGFEHSVANMYYLTAGWLAAPFYGAEVTLSPLAGLLNNLLPVTLGNIVGGSFLMGGGFWFAFIREERSRAA